MEGDTEPKTNKGDHAMTLTRVLLWSAVTTSLSAACTTLPRTIETPSGPVTTGDVVGPFEVLGVSNRLTTTNNRPTSPNLYEEFVDFDVPYGTEVIVPCVRAWWLGFGKLNPDDWNDPSATWTSNDHHWGLCDVNVYVDRIYAPDPATLTQKARIGVRLWLRDINGDDQTNCRVHYSLIYLGHSAP